jgi:diguanylate cyclase (GGDEF)-like protein/PAS domain S-box-containing protein
MLRASLARQRALRRAHRLAAELQQSEQRLTEVVRSLSDVIWSIALSPHPQFAFLSPSAERVFGLPLPRLFADPDAWLTLVHAEDRTLAGEMQIPREDRPTLESEYRIIRPDGSLRWLHHRSTWLFGADATALRVDAIISDITARREAEAALAESARQQTALLNNIPDMAWLKDRNHRFIAVNEAFGRVSGVAPAALVGKSEFDLWPDPIAHRCRLVDQEVVASGHGRRLQEVLLDHSGAEVWFETIKTPIFDARGQVVGTTGIARDISERRLQEEQLRLAATVFDNSFEGIMISDPNDVVIRVNTAFCDITGYRADEVVGHSPRMLRSQWQDQRFYDELWQSVRRSGRWEGETWDRRRNGELFAQWLRVAAVRNEQGDVSHYITMFADITERKQSEERIRHLAYHDVLTGLPNRSVLHDRIYQAISYAERDGRPVAVLFLDLDGFKVINDSLGHYLGDHLLQEVARRLVGCVRRQDTVTRHGGDEFIIVLAGCGDLTDAAGVAEKVLSALRRPYHFAGQDLAVAASIGISVYPEDGRDPQTLLRHADVAMYRIKARGGNHYQFFGRSPGPRSG